MRRSVFVATTGALAAAFLGVACDGAAAGAPRTLLLSWTFADGRTCAEAGVPAVYVAPPGADTATRIDCHAGLGQAVDAGPFAPGPLDVEAVSAAGSPLYRARATVPDADPAVLSVVLLFVAGAPGP